MEGSLYRFSYWLLYRRSGSRPSITFAHASRPVRLGAPGTVITTLRTRFRVPRTETRAGESRQRKRQSTQGSPADSKRRGTCLRLSPLAWAGTEIRQSPASIAWRWRCCTVALPPASRCARRGRCGPVRIAASTCSCKSAGPGSSELLDSCSDCRCRRAFGSAGNSVAGRTRNGVGAAQIHTQASVLLGPREFHRCRTP